MYEEIEDPEFLETASDNFDDDDEPYAERVIIFDEIDGEDDEPLDLELDGEDDDGRIAR